MAYQKAEAQQPQLDHGWHIARTIAGMVAPSDLIDEVLASDLVDDTSRSAAAEPVRAEVTARRRRRWGAEATLASVSLGMIGSFLAITRTIEGKNGNRFDRAVVRKMGEVRHPVSNAMMSGITFFGSAVGATAVSVSVSTPICPVAPPTSGCVR